MIAVCVSYVIPASVIRKTEPFERRATDEAEHSQDKRKIEPLSRYSAWNMKGPVEPERG